MTVIRPKIVVNCYLDILGERLGGKCYNVDGSDQPSNDVAAETAPAVAKPSKGTTPHLVCVTRRLPSSSYAQAPPSRRALV